MPIFTKRFPSHAHVSNNAIFVSVTERLSTREIGLIVVYAKHQTPRVINILFFLLVLGRYNEIHDVISRGA